MAEATFWMTVATWIQVGVAVIGTTAVLIALYYSREATRAATRSNDLTRESMIAQERAWIKIEHINIISPFEWNDSNQGKVTVEIHVRDIGKTPAFRVWPDMEVKAGMFAESTAAAIYRSVAAKAREGKSFEFGFALFPQDPLSFVQEVVVDKRIGIHRSLDGPIESPIIHLLLACCVTYELAFAGEQRQTGHAFIYWRPGANGFARSIGPTEGAVIEGELCRITGFGNDTFAD